MAADFEPVIIRKLVPDAEAGELHMLLRDGVQWQESVTKNHSRFAYALSSFDDPFVSVDAMKKLRKIVLSIVTKIGLSFHVDRGCYLNYYTSGDDYAPPHHHYNSIQLVISTGTSRFLTIDSDKYNFKNGDVAIFGPQKHGIPKQKNVKGHRISIAFFVSVDAKFKIPKEYKLASPVNGNTKTIKKKKEKKMVKKKKEKKTEKKKKLSSFGSKDSGTENSDSESGSKEPDPKPESNKNSGIAYSFTKEEYGKIPTVVNIKGTRDNPLYDVYIGRRINMGGWSLEESIYGNIGKKTLKEYREYALKNKKIMKSLKKLTGKKIGCWCHPEPCHGDVLVDLYIEYVLEKKPMF